MKSVFISFSLALLSVINPVFSQKSIEINGKRASEELKTDLINELYYTSNYDSAYTSKSEYLYDEHRNIILVQQFPFDGVTTGTKLLYKEEYSYNENNLLMEHSIYYIDYDLNMGDTILPVTKFTFEYDASNLLIFKYLYSWDIEGAQWNSTPGIKYEYVYNSINQLEQTNSYIYFETGWIPITSIIFVFDSANNTMNVSTNMYYNYKSEWAKSDSVVYFLNDDSLCTSQEKYIYNSADSTWKIITRSETQYNDLGAVIFSTSGNYFSQYYTPMNKSEYSYVNNDQLATVLNYNWKIDLDDTINKGSFILSMKDDYWYVDNGQLYFLLNSTWSEDQQNWNKNYAHEYIYDYKVKSSDNFMSDGIVLYPNPASENLYFKNLPADAIINIYDIRGMEVIHKKSDTENIPLNNLSDGIYFIEVSKDHIRLFNQVFIKKQ